MHGTYQINRVPVAFHFPHEPAATELCGFGLFRKQHHRARLGVSANLISGCIADYTNRRIGYVINALELAF